MKKRGQKIGHSVSFETRQKISNSLKGVIPWNKGKQVGLRAELNGNWKGNKVKYSGLHIWVKRHLGVSNKCSNCGTSRITRYHWANISREYKRDLNDWIRLCALCHKRYDLGRLKLVSDN